MPAQTMSRNTFRRLPLDVFLHCTLGGFAEEQDHNGTFHAPWTPWDTKVLLKYSRTHLDVHGRLRYGTVRRARDVLPARSLGSIRSHVYSLRMHGLLPPLKHAA